MSLKDYDPCSSCKLKKDGVKCLMGQKTMCSTFLMFDYLKKELQRGSESIPTEFLVEILQARGWHGELKHTEIVNI